MGRQRAVWCLRHEAPGPQPAGHTGDPQGCRAATSSARVAPRSQRCRVTGEPVAWPQGADMPLNDPTISRFLRSFPGEVLRPADDGFAPARAAAIWNGAITRQPALIVRPTSVEEVVQTVAFVRESGAEVTVRGGGHSAAGASVAEGAVMIDLSRLSGVRVDPGTRRAYVGGGATWADVDAATAPHGVAVVGGTVSHTGVAGLTLSGGMGWLTSQQGLSCDNLVAATLVTADGRTVTASDETHPELLWALRGAGT